MNIAPESLRVLTSEQVDQFRLAGHIVVHDLLSKEEGSFLAARADLVAAGKAPNIPESSIQLEQVFRDGDRSVENQVLSVRKLFNLAVYDQQLWEHIANPKIVDVIADLLGTDDLKLYGDQLFMKPPEVGSAQAWHQDSASWRDILPMDLVTAWTAIDDATEANGCLNFVPGTHRWGMLRRDQLEPFLADFGSSTWPVKAAPILSGSVSFHHSLVLHQSNANTSGARRRGYAAHYMRASSWRDHSVTDAPKMPPFRQVRGESFHGRV